jgi:hypothetical protein
MFSSDGTYIRQLAFTTATPNCIAIDGVGNIVVGDDMYIYLYNPTGTQLARFGTGIGSNGNGDLVSPRGVAIDSSGKLIISDTANSRIQIFG